MRRKLFYSIGVVGLTVALIFLNNREPVLSLKSGAFFALRPLFGLSRAASQAVDSSVAGGHDERALLREENRRLRGIEQDHVLLLERYADMRKILGLKERQRLPLQGAHILLRGSEFGKEFLMLDEGAAKKIREGNLVIDSDGALVGVVREVGDGFAKISIASNKGEAFEVVLAPLGVKALAKGIGGRAFSLELVPNEMPVGPGDFASMPGALGGANALVGEVTRVTQNGVGAFQNVAGVLVSRPEALDEVFVVLE